MQRIKQLLINKYAIYGTFAIWALIKSFAPVAHIDSSQPYFSIMPVDLANIVVYLPIAAFFYLLMYKNGTAKGKSIKLWKVFNINAFILMGYLMLAALAILQLYSINVLPIAARGSLVTWGMLTSLIMAIIYKLRSMPSPIAILISIIAMFWIIGFYETPYQIFRYYVSDYNLVLSLESLKIIVIREILLFLPFVVAFIVWKIRLTKLSLVSLIAFVALWLVWLIPGHFQTLYIIDTSLSTARSFMNDPIDWTWYHVGKTCKVLLALFILFLNYENLGLAKGEKHNAIQG